MRSMIGVILGDIAGSPMLYPWDLHTHTLFSGVVP